MISIHRCPGSWQDMGGQGAIASAACSRWFVVGSQFYQVGPGLVFWPPPWQRRIPKTIPTLILRSVLCEGLTKQPERASPKHARSTKLRLSKKLSFRHTDKVSTFYR
jgi:hypothetical protein